MKKIKENKWFLLIILVISILFYWFQIRPARITKVCVEIARDKANKELCSEYYEAKREESRGIMTGGINEFKRKCETGVYYEKDYQYHYATCLNEHGLK